MAPFKFSKDSDESDAPSNNLWVGNLAADVTDTDLMCLFAKFGALDCVTSSSSRNYAFVYFMRVEDAMAAKDTLQSTLVRGNSLRIEFARPARPSKLLWVGGISPAVSKEYLKQEFLKFGKIEDFVFNRERNTASMEFLALEDALEAMKNMNGKRMGGDQIRVDFLRSHTLRRDQLADIKESQFSAIHPGVRRVPPSGGRKEGPPSKVLWVGYPPSLQIDEQMLHNAMILFGEIEKIKSFPSRYYSFVEFRSIDEARRAKEGLQGRLFNDPRISIMYSSSSLAPGNAGTRNSGPEILNENIFGSSPIGINSIHRPNLPVRPFGSQSGSDMHRRPTSPGAGGLLSPASRIKPPVRSVSTGWDVLDPSQLQREPKRSRIDAVSPIDDDSFPTRKIDDRGLSLDRTYRFPPVSGPFVNGQRKRSRSPVGSSHHRVGNDFIWRGVIAKGGTPVCLARCVPFDKETETELPEVVNCSARTGLDMLAKHYAQAIGFEVVFFLPDSEEDFASYTEFLHYLGSKNRAGVAKFDDGTTLFLVPPSDFLTDVLNVKGPERLYGVVLKLPQVPTMEPQLRQPSHFPQFTERPSIPPLDDDYNQITRKEEQIPMNYSRVFQEEAKTASKSIYPTMSESNVEQSVPQNLFTNNTAAVSRVPGVSELIATIASFLPANGQSAAVESGQQIPSSSAIGQQLPVSSIGGQQIPGSFVRPPFSPFVADKGTSHGWKQSGNPSQFQYASQLSSQPQFQSPYQPYPPIPNVTNSSENVIHGQDSSVNIQQHGGMQSRPLVSVPMISQSGQGPMISQGGYVAMSSPQVSHQHPLELAHQKGYGATSLGIDNSAVGYSPSVVQQPVNPMMFSSQAQGGNYSHTQPGMLPPADKVNWEIPNQVQVQEFQTGLPGSDQGGSSEVEVDKNQKYQSTLQFAANLLLQIQQQQQQQQQTGNASVQGSGNQQ